MPAGSVLFTSRAPIGYVAVARGPVCTNQGFKSFVPSKAVTSDYLYWFLRHATPAIRATGSGTTFAEVSKKRVQPFPIPLPPLNEQQRIVAAIEEHFSRLDASDRSLDTAKRRLTTLRAATLAAATGGHEPVELGTLVTGLRYGTSLKCSYEAKGSPVLRIPNVQGGSVDLSDLKFAIDANLDLSSFALKRGDLLVVRTNGSRDLIGRVASVDGAEGMAFASYLIRARPDASRLDSRFAVIALSTPASRALIESKAATSAGQYNLNLAALRALPVPLPPIEEQRSIVAEVERQLSLIEAMDAQMDRATRQSRSLGRAILARAFCGELVPQLPDDEPAAVLLERIAQQRALAPRRPRRAREKTPA
jgi:type I restriction enzyme S subunit